MSSLRVVYRRNPPVFAVTTSRPHVSLQSQGTHAFHWLSRSAQQWVSSDDIDRYLDQDTADVDIKPGLDRPELDSNTLIFFLFIVKYILNLLEDIYFLL